MQFSKLMILTAVSTITLSSAAIADSTIEPDLMRDSAWATFSGEVTKVYPDAFELDYGEGNLIVEVDDGDWDSDAYKFFKGDNVTVTGRIDQNLFSETSLEAGSIYVEGLNTTFFSQPIDEEDLPLTYMAAYVPAELDTVTIVGDVASTSSLLDTVSISVGGETLTVDLSELGFDPLDDEGWLKVEKGDTVKVTAEINEDFFDGYDLMAEQLIIIDS